MNKQRKSLNPRNPLIRIIPVLTMLFLLPGCDTITKFFNPPKVTSTQYSHPTFAPDGRIVAHKYEKYDDGSTKFLIVIMNQDGSGENVIASALNTVLMIEVSPLMNYVIAGATLFNMKTGAVIKDKIETGEKYDWSPDEKYIAVAVRETQLNGDYNPNGRILLKIYDPFTNTLVKDLGYEIGDHLCWKYKDKIAFTMDDEIHYPNTFLCFVNADGTGLVTTNIQMYPEGYDKDKNYLYDWHGGFCRVDLSVSPSALVAEAVYSYSQADYPVCGISPDGTKIIMRDWENIMRYAIYIKDVDGTNFKLVKQ